VAQPTVERRAYKVREVCAILNISRGTVSTLIERGELPAFRVRHEWRVDACDLDSYIERQKEAARLSRGGVEER